jgi:tetratricopeptide (TPR) repeat protein
MRRYLIILFALFLLLAPAQAQQGRIGKNVLLSAGSPEDKALTEVTEATDPAKKLELLDKWLAEYGKGDLAILAYEMYVVHYTSERNYDKAFEYGEKLFALDPDAINMTVSLIRLASEKPDVQRMFSYGERVAATIERYKARPPAEGTNPDDWARFKTETLADLSSTIGFVEYTMFTTGYQLQDVAQRAALLERFVTAFPKSPYSSQAQVMAADAYQQARAPQKMVAFAQKILVGEPDNFWMMVVLADYWATNQEQLDAAEAHAKKALTLIEQAPKIEGITEEDWLKQKALQQGLAWSALGQINVHKNRDAQAVDALKTASPLLKPYDYYYGRNLFFLGWALGRMKRLAEARPVLAEAATVNSPYKAKAQETLGKIGGAAPAKQAPAKKRP